MGHPNGTAHAPGSHFSSSIPGHPAMQSHPYPKHLASKIQDPFLPRANLAVSAETPDGTPGWSKEHSHQSTLEQHCLFFNPKGDGIIWPMDTYRGFSQLGYAVVWCVLSMFIIHSGFSYFTGNSWLPDPFFRITLPNIHRAKHGSDTGTYDSEGRFVPAKFERIFSSYDKDNKGGLYFTEGLKMIRGNRNIADPVGWLAAFFEWFATYFLIWPANGIVSKEAMRTVYDGSIFFDIAAKEKKRKQTPGSGIWKNN